MRITRSRQHKSTAFQACLARAHSQPQATAETLLSHQDLPKTQYAPFAAGETVWRHRSDLFTDPLVTSIWVNRCSPRLQVPREFYPAHQTPTAENCSCIEAEFAQLELGLAVRMRLAPQQQATRFCNPYVSDASQSNPYVSDAKDASNDRNVRIRIRSQRTGEQGDALGQPDYSQLHCPFTKTGTSVPSAMIPVMSISSVPIIKSTCVAEVFTPWAASASASIS